MSVVSDEKDMGKNLSVCSLYNCNNCDENIKT